MIRYSTYRGTNYPTDPSAPIELLGSIAKEYRELQELREQVRKAEAAAAERLRPRGKLAECTRPVVRVVSRKRVMRRPVTRQPSEFTKAELRAVLAEAVRNTG
jgi:hypothetical protein